MFLDLWLLAVDPSRFPLFFRIKPAGSYRYLQIAHSVREGKTVRQQVIATLGRLDLLQASGTSSTSNGPSKTRRYVVCLNEEKRRKDAHDREAIVAQHDGVYFDEELMVRFLDPTLLD